jgi:PAS domain-containing protein
VKREECSERIHLADEYSRLITEFNTLLKSLKSRSFEVNETVWRATETAKALSEKAWMALERHLREHNCIEMHGSPHLPDVSGSRNVLEMAALAALDVIMVADDEQRFVDVNEAAAEAVGLPRSQIIGRRVDEFIKEVRGGPFPVAWAAFVADGVQAGTCVIMAAGKRRTFMYRAKANFAPGLHLGILREVSEEENR